MLANGIKIGYSTSGTTSYTDIEGLQEVPDIGVEPEKVENTCLSDSVKQYEKGIGDAGDMEFKFKYTNAVWKVLRGFESASKPTNFKVTYPDGASVSFSAEVSNKLGGGSVNDPIAITTSMALQSELTWADPS
ncbi:tail protein [Terrisporobacter othiniensis]|uniref:Tail protein n=1 Tax=Terrisporobacter othiniensis TaxID=1577792 RepID=A0A0B3VTM5_9FIRM|nr:phage tail tube protein [Terrisporobacter othiniensis]KHS56158.1 tail protein [Terrisporobacter othiniensis]